MADTKYISESFIQNQVRAFKKVKPTYDLMTRLIQKVLSKAANDLGILAIVQSRSKKPPSFAEKCVRKHDNYPDPINMFDDLCGGRVIVPTEREISPVCDFIRKKFIVLEEDDVFKRLGVTEFGYNSVHFVVAFEKGYLTEILETLSSRDFERTIDDFTFTGRGSGSRITRSKLCHYLCQQTVLNKNTALEKKHPRFRLEIQVRSILQHAWSEITHDRLYKSDFRVPEQLKRIAGRVAATLEEAESVFCNIVADFNEYKTYYGSYLTPKQRKEEKNKLLAVLPFDKNNKHLAIQIARLAMSLGEWENSYKVLKKYVSDWEALEKTKDFIKLFEAFKKEDDPDKLKEIEIILNDLRDPLMSALLADYGRTSWKLDLDGRNYLDFASGLALDNVTPCIFMAETYTDEGEEDKAIEYYEKAFKICPTDPQVLAGLLYCKIVTDRSLDFVMIARSSLEMAIQCCRERIKAEIYLPMAYYDMGFFAFLLNRPYDSLSAYARAISLSDSIPLIESTLQRVNKMQRALRNNTPKELNWIHRFLISAKSAKHYQIKEMLEAEINAHTTQLNNIQNELDMLEGGKRSKERTKKLSELRERFSDKELTLKHLKSELHTNSLGLNKSLKDCGSLKILDNSTILTDRILLIAGGCDQRYEAAIMEFKGFFKHALKDFEGVIFCGCTNAGVNKLVGDLNVRGKKIRRYTYMPAKIPSWTSKHPKLIPISTKSEGFSADDAIQNWIDLLALGVTPSKVRLFGLGGGDISGFEYRMAAAFGAKVGLIPSSGRAAKDIFEDEDWSKASGLILLPNDIETVSIFICGYQPCKTLGSHREIIAKKVHELYRQEQFESISKDMPNLKDWEQLSEEFKESNRQQVDHIEAKLNAVGLTIRHKEKGRIHLYTFNREQTEKMAEIEHARWNVERLMEGWRYNKEKNVEEKLSPYLIPWSDLPEEIKKWDRDTVESIPENLKKIGFEIMKINIKTKKAKSKK